MLVPCPACGAHLRREGDPCPHCAGPQGPPCPGQGAPRLSAALLGLALVAATGCAGQAEYGVLVTDEDQDEDGWFSHLDCDDGDPAIHPEAKETAGDGVDSNCDGEDDT